MTSAKYTKQITGILDQHVEHVIQVLAEKYEFDIEEARRIVGAAPEKPKKKKNPTAYIRFCNQERIKLKQELPDTPPKEILVILGARWKALSDDEKRPFKEAYEAAKDS
jgi:hypothetical protein